MTGAPRHYTEDECSKVTKWSTIAAISMPNHVWYYCYAMALCARYTEMSPHPFVWDENFEIVVPTHEGQMLIRWIGRHPMRAGVRHPTTAQAAQETR